MKTEKIHYKCSYCEKEYWATPFVDANMVECTHPCLECNTQIVVKFDGIYATSLQFEVAK